MLCVNIWRPEYPHFLLDFSSFFVPFIHFSNFLHIYLEPPSSWFGTRAHFGVFFAPLHWAKDLEFFSAVQFASHTQHLVDQRQTGNRVLTRSLKEAYSIAASACQDTCQHVGRLSWYANSWLCQKKYKYECNLPFAGILHPYPRNSNSVFYIFCILTCHNAKSVFLPPSPRSTYPRTSFRKQFIARRPLLAHAHLQIIPPRWKEDENNICATPA